MSVTVDHPIDLSTSSSMSSGSLVMAPTPSQAIPPINEYGETTQRPPIRTITATRRSSQRHVQTSDKFLRKFRREIAEMEAAVRFNSSSSSSNNLNSGVEKDDAIENKGSSSRAQDDNNIAKSSFINSSNNNNNNNNKNDEDIKSNLSSSSTAVSNTTTTTTIIINTANTSNYNKNNNASSKTTTNHSNISTRNNFSSPTYDSNNANKSILIENNNNNNLNYNGNINNNSSTTTTTTTKATSKGSRGHRASNTKSVTNQFLKADENFETTSFIDPSSSSSVAAAAHFFKSHNHLQKEFVNSNSNNLTSATIIISKSSSMSNSRGSNIPTVGTTTNVAVVKRASGIPRYSEAKIVTNQKENKPSVVSSVKGGAHENSLAPVENTISNETSNNSRLATNSSTRMPAATSTTESTSSPPSQNNRNQESSMLRRASGTTNSKSTIGSSSNLNGEEAKPVFSKSLANKIANAKHHLTKKSSENESHARKKTVNGTGNGQHTSKVASIVSSSDQKSKTQHSKSPIKANQHQRVANNTQLNKNMTK